MLINADFTQRAELLPEQYVWIPSPQGGVERVMLDRIGAEKARATSIVCYAKSSHFPEHTHPGGEEILVLDGVFSEGGKDYPAGWYMRNPPGSAHQPSSESGATIFVKLWQMPSTEASFVRVNTNDPANWMIRGTRKICPLFAGNGEEVMLMRLAASERLFVEHAGGAEILVTEGSFKAKSRTYSKGSWIRLPRGGGAEFVVGATGATFYLKTGHLPVAEADLRPLP